MTSPFLILAPLILALTAFACLAPESRHVSKEVYLDLVFYFKYASSAYTLICPYPNGQTLVELFKNLLTGTQGFIARDDTRQEIVVALRGSFSFIDMTTDAGIILIPFHSPGVAAPQGTMVHAGFLTSWNSVAIDVLKSVAMELQAHPGYGLVTSGHSLGGALASLAAMSLKTNFPFSNVAMYTYGQPRTGNSIYAHWVNSQLSGNAYRVVHTYDGVPTIIPALWLASLRNQFRTSNPLAGIGYRHHGIEYWQNPDPASENTTRRCDSDGEDPECSASIPSTGINGPHLAYFGILAMQPFCVAQAEPSPNASHI